MRSRKTSNKGSKKSRVIMIRGRKNQKKSLKKIQIAGGREELLKKRIELYAELFKLIEIDSVSQD